LLILTATDMAPLCGVHPKACIRKYGGKPLRTEYCHELAVRLLAGSLAMTAAKYEMGINIIFSHSTDHYVRIYAIAKCGAKKGNENVKNMGYILHCFKCLHREKVKGLFLIRHAGKCSECGSKMDVAGPLWLGKLFDGRFCELVRKEVKRMAFKHGKKIRKILTLIENEVEAPITYYVVDKLCDTLNLPVPPVKKVIKALKERDFQAVLTHFNSTGIRSNASASDIKELLFKIVKAKW